jgi:acetyl esterase/lipase
MLETATIVYGYVDGASLLADLARPAGKAPLPLVLSVHGGRWYYGTRRDTGAIDVRQWAGFGFVAMSIDYRLVTCTPAPACYQDMLCAIRWAHANAEAYGIDTSRIFLIGMSAGGHMVSLAATLGEGKFPRSGGWEDYPTTFRAAISVSGCYDTPASCSCRLPAASAAAFRRRPLDPHRAGAAHAIRAGTRRRAAPVRALP